MKFEILDRWGNYPEDVRSQVFLTWDNWNDYHFHTLFGIFFIDEKGEKVDLGAIKIGYFGQKEYDVKLSVGDNFTSLEDIFFSVGVDVDYYRKLDNLGDEIRSAILSGLNDIALNEVLFQRAILEEVTKVSFLRGNSEATIVGQFRRMANGGSELTNFNFKFLTHEFQEERNLELKFEVDPTSNPPSNIHVIIGRNGVGKTNLINNMIDSIMRPDKEGICGDFLYLKDDYSEFFTIDSVMEIGEENNCDKYVSLNGDYSKLFANLVCVSFSAFDDFDHPPEQRDKSIGVQYSYIGLKEVDEKGRGNEHQKNFNSLTREFAKSLFFCINNSRINRWKAVIQILESDPIFKSANILEFIDYFTKGNNDKMIESCEKLFKSLSSGHRIVLLTITRLVETVQEKSLVLFDEPESYLHPPLLSSFIRAISDLLKNRNGVAIIATHSPVILQEVPKSCVWKLRRNGNNAFAERLEIESFGENVGILTQEVFNLEVTDSGFHKLLKKLVLENSSYYEALEVLNNQLGMEAKAILRSLFYQKEKLNEDNT